MLVVGAVSRAFLNNTPIVVMLLPILIGASLRAKQSASGILLPMGLATLLGGMATTIGTSTNLLVVSIAGPPASRLRHRPGVPAQRQAFAALDGNSMPPAFCNTSSFVLPWAKPSSLRWSHASNTRDELSPIRD